MTQDDNKLLYKDLCARLPYGVIVKFKSREREGTVKLSDGNIGYVTNLSTGWWSECKPYLRRLSSMTEDERQEYGLILCGELSINYYDWLNEHHFDYRGLIDKGLAIKVTKKNNPYEN